MKRYLVLAIAIGFVSLRAFAQLGGAYDPSTYAERRQAAYEQQKDNELRRYYEGIAEEIRTQNLKLVQKTIAVDLKDGKADNQVTIDFINSVKPVKQEDNTIRSSAGLYQQQYIDQLYNYKQRYMVDLDGYKTALPYLKRMAKVDLQNMYGEAQAYARIAEASRRANINANLKAIKDAECRANIRPQSECTETYLADEQRRQNDRQDAMMQHPMFRYLGI